MRKIIVDTNIIFSCLLNSQGKIGDLIFNSDKVSTFYSADYMRLEIRKHWIKLRKISKLGEIELGIAFDNMLSKIVFINEALIPLNDWKRAEATVEAIDPDDIDFVAMTRYLKGSLWTGNKQLYEGLKAKRFRSVYSTHDLIRLRTCLMAA